MRSRKSIAFTDKEANDFDVAQNGPHTQDETERLGRLLCEILTGRVNNTCIQSCGLCSRGNCCKGEATS